jgi:hypothetical protein
MAGYTGPVNSPSAPAGTILIISSLLPHRARQELGDVLGDLEAVASLPAELRSNAEAGRALAEMVFSGAASWVDADTAQQIVELLAGGVEAERLHHSGGRDSDYTILSAELRALSAGLARVGVEPLTQWMRTGIDRGVETAEVQIPPAKRVRGLLAELSRDPELAGIAKLARDLLAAIHIPRVLVSPEDLPVGGVSDIANRGPLDRLLISELAHDELTLAVRVALNEALYLRRESPAQHPPFARAILIDAGIRMWGVPRLYATAVALALAASADVRGAVTANRPRTAGSVDHVDLLTREGVTRHLESLDSAPHPGPSLAPWLDALQQLPEADAELETFIVTHEDALRDPQFLRDLRGADDSRDWHVATVGRDGAFALWLISRAGTRELCRADLDLEQIVAQPKPSPASSAQLLASDRKFPLILDMQPFPLLLPAAIDPRHVALSRVGSLHAFGTVGITNDRRLMVWQSTSKGARQLTAAIPGGRISGVVVDNERMLAHVVITPSRMNRIHILSADLRTGHCTGRDYNRNHPLHVSFRDGLIFLIYGDHVCAIDPPSGSERIIKIPPEMHWTHGRFFNRRGEVHALAQDGFVFVNKIPCASAFDRSDGPWMLLKDGDLVPAGGEKALTIAKKWRANIVTSVSLVDVSPDGNRVAIRVYDTSKNGGAGVYWIDLADSGSLQWQWISRQAKPEELYRRLNGGCIKPSTACSVTPRNNFMGMFVSDAGELALQTWNGRSIVTFTSDGGPPLLKDAAGRADAAASRFARFVQTRAPQHARYTLKVARWKDGSQAFLDSRGMVHLVSSDRALPQMTLALSNERIAIWASDGHVIGPEFFLNDKPTMTADVAATLLRSFASRLQ